MNAVVTIWTRYTYILAGTSKNTGFARKTSLPKGEHLNHTWKRNSLYIFYEVHLSIEDKCDLYIWTKDIGVLRIMMFLHVDDWLTFNCISDWCMFKHYCPDKLLYVRCTRLTTSTWSTFVVNYRNLEWWSYILYNLGRTEARTFTKYCPKGELNSLKDASVLDILISSCNVSYRTVDITIDTQLFVVFEDIDFCILSTKFIACLYKTQRYIKQSGWFKQIDITCIIVYVLLSITRWL